MNHTCLRSLNTNESSELTSGFLGHRTLRMTGQHPLNLSMPIVNVTDHQKLVGPETSSGKPLLKEKQRKNEGLTNMHWTRNKDT